MSGTKAAPAADQAPQDFSLRRARQEIEEGCVPIHDFAIAFLTARRGGNARLAEYLERHAKCWLGPIEVNIDNIETIAGPGKQYHESEEAWEKRIGNILKRLRDYRQLPPLIAGLKSSIDGEAEPSSVLKLVDGAHRLEALRRLGHKTAWLLLFFSDAISRYNFLREYNAGLHNIKYRSLNTQPDPPRTKLHTHYVRGHAEKYDAAREGQPHWHTEYQAVAELLRPSGAVRLLDAPFGTGRFLPIYQELGCTVVGSDVSRDMLAVARARAVKLGFDGLEVLQGDVAVLDFEEVDTAVCVRYLNMLPPETARRTIHNLARASRRQMILHIGSIDDAAMPPDEQAGFLQWLESAHQVQRQDMKYVAHRWSSVLEWCGSCGFHLAESIDTQESDSKFGHIRMHRFLRQAA